MRIRYDEFTYSYWRVDQIFMATTVRIEKPNLTNLPKDLGAQIFRRRKPKIPEGIINVP